MVCLMGYHAFCLITEWPPAVTAYREAGGMDFYWHADDPVDLDSPTLPYTIERDFMGGWAFQAAVFFYESLRPHLPDPVLRPTDAYLEMIYSEVRDAPYINDLARDAHIEPGKGDTYLWYAMRPDTASRAARLADAVPWSRIESVAAGVAGDLYTDESYMPDVAWFRYVVDTHTGWLREATELDRGAVAVVSF